MKISDLKKAISDLEDRLGPYSDINDLEVLIQSQSELTNIGIGTYECLDEVGEKKKVFCVYLK